MCYIALLVSVFGGTFVSFMALLFVVFSPSQDLFSPYLPAESAEKFIWSFSRKLCSRLYMHYLWLQNNTFCDPFQNWYIYSHTFKIDWAKKMTHDQYSWPKWDELQNKNSKNFWFFSSLFLYIKYLGCPSTKSQRTKLLRRNQLQICIQGTRKCWL